MKNSNESGVNVIPQCVSEKGSSYNEKDYGSFVRTVKDVATGKGKPAVLLCPDINARSGFSSIDRGNVVETLIASTKEANSNWGQLSKRMIGEIDSMFRNKTRQPLMVVDAIFALRATTVKETLPKLYASNHAVSKWLNTVIARIEKARSEEGLNKALDKYKGQYYVLIGGFSRASILLDAYLRADCKSEDRKEIGKTIIPFQITMIQEFTKIDLSRFILDPEYDKQEYYDLWDVAIKEVVMRDNADQKKSIDQKHQSHAYYKIFNLLMKINGFGSKTPFMELCRKLKPCLDSIDGKGSYNSFRLKLLFSMLYDAYPEVDSGTISYVVYFAEEFYRGYSKVDLPVFSKSLTEIEDKETLDRIVKAVVDFRDELAKKGLTVNSSSISKFTKTLLATEYSDVKGSLSAQQSLQVLNKALSAALTSDIKVEKVDLNNADKRRLEKALSENVEMKKTILLYKNQMKISKSREKQKDKRIRQLERLFANIGNAYLKEVNN